MDKFEIVENVEAVEVNTHSDKVGVVLKEPASKGFAAHITSSTPVENCPDIEAHVRGEEVAYSDNEFDHQYKDNLRIIMQDGEKRTDRTGVNTISMFGDIGHKIDLRRGYPGTTLKRLAFEANKVETMDWMLQGKTDLKTLKDKGVRIWDQNVIHGTEVYEGKPLELFERLRMLGKHQLESINTFMGDLDVPFFSEEDGSRDYRIDECTTDQKFAIDSKLNNWGIPERALSGGDLGPIYGKQWRAWEDIRIVPGAMLHRDNPVWNKLKENGFEYTADLLESSDVIIRRSIDQVAQVEKAVAERSDSRRIILTGWNVAQLDEMSLPPCHTMAQWSVSQKTDSNGKQFLDCKLYQRSADMLLGVPFNIAQYALITEMLAHVHGLTARFLHHTIGDAHIYQNHIDKGFIQEIMERPVIHKSPTLSISGTYNSITEIPTDRVWMVDYQSHEAQKNVPIAK